MRVCVSVCLCLCLCLCLCTCVCRRRRWRQHLTPARGLNSQPAHLTLCLSCSLDRGRHPSRNIRRKFWFFEPFGGMLMAPWFCGRLNQSWFWARFLLCAGQQPHKLWTGLIISRDQLSIRTKQKQTKLDWDCQSKSLHCCWTMSLFYKTPTSLITINVEIGSSSLSVWPRLAYPSWISLWTTESRTLSVVQDGIWSNIEIHWRYISKQQLNYFSFSHREIYFWTPCFTLPF